MTKATRALLGEQLRLIAQQARRVGDAESLGLHTRLKDAAFLISTCKAAADELARMEQAVEHWRDEVGKREARASTATEWKRRAEEAERRLAGYEQRNDAFEALMRATQMVLQRAASTG